MRFLSSVVQPDDLGFCESGCRHRYDSFSRVEDRRRPGQFHDGTFNLCDADSIADAVTIQISPSQQIGNKLARTDRKGERHSAKEGGDENNGDVCDEGDVDIHLIETGEDGCNHNDDLGEPRQERRVRRMHDAGDEAVSHGAEKPADQNNDAADDELWDIGK